jgi:hypothetical protein
MTSKTVPRYVMPDASVPPCEIILDHLCEHHDICIGSSYYYISAYGKEHMLCRIDYINDKIALHEIIDHEQYGISDDDIDNAIESDTGSPRLPNIYCISPHIETKLRIN